MNKETKVNIIVGAVIVTVFAIFTSMAFSPSKVSKPEEREGIEYDSTSSEKYDKFDTDSDGRLDEYEMKEYSHYVMDSMVNQSRIKSDFDKAKNSIDNSGVEITNVSITHDEYSSKWDNIRVSFKNSTGKTIKAIRFMWYDVKNAFGEELNPTYDGGNFTEIVKNGKQTYGTWETYEDQMESVKVYVSKIVFTDGTEWNNK
jgi:hypothetical protein